MLRHPDYTRNRLWRLSQDLFAKIYLANKPVDEILVSPPVGRINWGEAQRLNYKPTRLGEQFGPLWTTFWFKVKATVPPEWEGKRVDLLWNSRSEATLWMKGRILQGLNFEPSRLKYPARQDAVLLDRVTGKQTLEFHIEMACNTLFGKGVVAYDHISPFVLDRCELAAFDAQAWDIYYDFMVLQELEAEQRNDLDKAWGGKLLSELNRFANVYDRDERRTWSEAHKILKQLCAHTNGSVAHEQSAIGHAHIDTAWLWPIAETWRKCERTFSSQLAYMDAYPEYKFACSQAVQYATIKQRNPDLYQRLKDKVKAGQFVPVGGSWVEPDCNIPSGEALARQFIHGQRFFQQEFGLTCKEFWNPDVFGYNGQLPQIMKLSGITRFLTQKLSWNAFNKPVHHTFLWEGIDGSEVLAHFPPTDTYNGMCNVAEVRRGAREYKDNDRSQHSLLLFGFGDGGGGPTKEMLEQLRRYKDLQGIPRTQIRSSDEFFTLLAQDLSDRPRMVGELYFEYHRGTYTTQAATKRDNRKNEFLLHDVEFLATCAQKTAKALYPAGELDRLWKLLLVNQFHDILPGSSITEVYQDTAKDHSEIRRSGENLRQQALSALVPPQGNVFNPVNTLSFDRREVAQQPDGALTFVEAPPCGIGKCTTPSDKVLNQKQPNGNIVLENAGLRAELSPDGTLVSLIDKHSGREAMAGAGNQFEIYDDKPTNYDAWDIDPFHLETRKECEPAKFLGVRGDALRAEASFERKIGAHSAMKQFVRLDAGARRLEFHTIMDWKENSKVLKVAFPVNVRAMNATYEMQFGAVERPTHFNTPYDVARYEVPGHKWSDLSEYGFGVALLSESKYGYSTLGNTLRMTLLRAPKSPDPMADMGEHSFAYAIMPHAGDWRDGGVVAEAHRFNVPLVWAKGTARESKSFAACSERNLVLDTIKKAEDSDAIVLRLYECHGARGTARVSCALPFTQAQFCNLLEQDQGAAEIKDGEILVPYAPFQVISLRLS